ncbi:protein disulfide-isomerase LQY1, chloroplastic-like isoform X2 [Glycine soja]|uniref:protein disulfide-isomerase LQY1, chloroplastic-like isoform X2 n=1 Tax=Glycine soja TaxID=3848 RepID=UPI000719389E|nr:protein disulfide-isomerase LQY1, chloroplastic-like isoform X2 [Glycine soja]|eukprot:XP_014625539.1 protein disulfide-isomerase LQY1, chloroplastic isoform X2 [Glycine max]
MTVLSPSLSRPKLQSSFLCCPLKYSKPTNRNIQPKPTSYPRIRALDLDQNTAKRENTQPCFPCNGSGAQKCRFCLGNGNVTVELGGGEEEVSRCINCDGVGSLTCTTCQGSGIQPRYLDRREFKDDD